MTSPMLSENFVKAMAQDIYKCAFEEYTKEEKIWPLVCDTMTLNTGDGFKGTTMSDLDILDDIPDGQEANLTAFGEGYTWQIRIKNMRKKFQITENLLADTPPEKLANDIETLARKWGEKVRLTEDVAVARLFNKGTLTAGDTKAFDGSFTDNTDSNAAFIYDGLPWFDGAHPLYSDSSQTFSNIITSAAFSKTTLETAWGVMTVTNAIDERGHEIVIKPDVIVANPSLKFTIDAVLKSQYGVDANMTVNTSFNIVEPIYWRLIDDTDAWFLGCRKKGILFIDRAPMYVETTWNGSTKCWDVEVKRRFGVGITDWRYWYAANQADS